MLALEVFEGDEERLCLLGRQAILAEASYERTLLRDVLGTFLDVPPDHLKFGFACAHLGSIADALGLGSTRPLHPQQPFTRSSWLSSDPSCRPGRPRTVYAI